MSKIYEWIKAHSLKIFAILVLASLVYSPYSMYLETQQEIVASLEEHRPILVIRQEFVKQGIQLFPQTRHINFYIKHNLQNTGDREAYQIKAYVAAAPLDDPEAYKFGTQIFTNPLDPDPNYMKTVDHIWGGDYSVRNDVGIVMIYLRVEYSNSSDGELYPPKENWIALTIPLNDGESSTPFVDNEPKFAEANTEWIEQHRPFVYKWLHDIGIEVGVEK